MDNKFIKYTTPFVFVWYALLRWLIFSHMGIEKHGDFLAWIYPNVMTGLILIYLALTYVIYYRYDINIIKSRIYIGATIFLAVYHCYCFINCLRYYPITDSTMWITSFILDTFFMIYFLERMRNSFFLSIKHILNNHIILNANQAILLYGKKI